jgi:ATP-dependent Clp protease ATP-binding subunit ClpA
MLAQEGFDPSYGARPLRRIIQKKILNPLAKEIVTNTYDTGDTVNIKVNDTGDALVFIKD